MLYRRKIWIKTPIETNLEFDTGFVNFCQGIPNYLRIERNSFLAKYMLPCQCALDQLRCMFN